MYTAIANTDIAHTIGNVSFIMTEFIRDLFPKNFFTYTHIGSMMPYREFVYNERNIRQRFMKKTFPLISIRPRPIIFDDDIFMARSNFTTPVYSTIADPDRSNYNRFFRDDVNDITISYMMNRMRVQCQVTMVFDSLMQQFNIYNYLRNLFIDSRPYWLKTSLEVFIPRELIGYVADISGNKIRDPESGSVRKFLEYLMNNSNKYFTFKEKNSTQAEEFFLYYPINMEYVFTDFTLNDPSNVGDVLDRATIDFVMTSEFNTPAMFQISTERDDTVLKANTEIKSNMFSGTTVKPYFTINNLFKETNEKGWKLFYTNIFNTEEDVPKNEPDVLPLDVVFKDSDLKEILDYNNKNGISNEILFEFVLMKNNERMNCDRSKGPLDFKVDLDEQKMYIYNHNHNATYRLLIYVNNLYIVKLFNIISNVEETYEKPYNKEKVDATNETKETEKNDPTS